jgi:toxin-antitoxin system PIN domain toxin
VIDLPDVNVWLALSASEHVHHGRAVGYWTDAAAPRIAFCRTTGLAFLRLLCNRVVMSDAPLSASEAWSTYESWLSQPEVVFAREPDGCEELLGAWAREGMVARHGWMDAYLAAFAIARGMRLATFDREFKEFADLELVLLGADE